MMTADSALYVGEMDAKFYKLKSVVSSYARKLEVATSMEAAKKLLETQTINLIILNLGLDAEQNHMIVEEIRKNRPRMQFISFGRSLSEVVKDNYYSIARGVDGTITVQQFEVAIKQVEYESRAGFRLLVTAVICLTTILVLGFASGSPFGKFLAVFWVTILLGEGVYCVITSRNRVQ